MDDVQPDRALVRRLLERERQRFVEAHPACGEAFRSGRDSLFGGVPMSWMLKWPGGYPLVVREASGARLVDLEGHELVDLCLGDTGAMAGHAPPATARAVERQASRGLATMLPSDDAAVVAAELTRRFGPTRWQFTLSATDANRFAIRIAREVTGRPRILVFDHCYHGTVDETLATLDGEGRVVATAGSVGPPVDPAVTTRVVQFNDLPGLQAALAHGDVACVLTEPAMTNVGIVLPEAGFHDALRRVTRDTGTLLVIDETHTFSAGPGGYTAAHGLMPDMVTVGKAIAGGIPAGALGMTGELENRALGREGADYVDVGGIGGTLAGNPLSLAAMRATLSEVLTDDAFGHTVPLAARWAEGVRNVVSELGLHWHVTQLGCRAEYLFRAEPPRTGAEAASARDALLEDYLHLAALNRGVLMTPFHNMALMSPATTEGDVDRHTAVFREVVAELV